MPSSSADTRLSRGATADSALAAPTVTARIPTDVSIDVTNERRSMASFSGRRRTTRKTIRHSAEMRFLSLVSFYLPQLKCCRQINLKHG
jgi:hypothetical protein